MKWFIPSWNGDIRVESQGDGESTVLKAFSPTPAELEVLEKFGAHCVKEGWVESWRKRWGKEVSITIDAPFATVGAVAAQYMRPGAAVLTGISLRDGRIETYEGPPVVLEQKVAEAAAEGATAAVTVKRPTPCCPACIPGSVAPASEVLLSFLSPEEHAMWAEYRAIIVTGGLTGHRYLLAHRHSDIGQKLGRICFDLDSREIVHFHDWSVPPEEEVLAAKLILESRELWLRNEATLHTLAITTALIEQYQIFKNPFGDWRDGVDDATFCEGFWRSYAAGKGVKIEDRVWKETPVPEALWR